MKQAVSKTRQQGLTLLELMVVLAIIGILATVGATQFQNYIARARTAEGLNLVAPYKVAVEEQITANNGIFTLPQLGLPAFVATENVTNIVVTPMAARGVGGRITITYGARIGAGARTLTLTPWVTATGVEWQCAAAGVVTRVAGDAIDNTEFAPGTLPANLAPANCRG